MDKLFSKVIDKYSTKAVEAAVAGSLCTLEELIESVVRLDKFSQASPCLEARPHLLHSLRRAIRQLDKVAHHHVEVAAYFKYKEREAMHVFPLHGNELDDWLAAEREIPAQLEKLVNELTEMADAELACAEASVT